MQEPLFPACGAWRRHPPSVGATTKLGGFSMKKRLVALLCALLLLVSAAAAEASQTYDVTVDEFLDALDAYVDGGVYDNRRTSDGVDWITSGNNTIAVFYDGDYLAGVAVVSTPDAVRADITPIVSDAYHALCATGVAQPDEADFTQKVNALVLGMLLAGQVDTPSELEDYNSLISFVITDANALLVIQYSPAAVAGSEAPVGSEAAVQGGIDLSGMSYDELVALRDQINLAMWQSDEWQEVEVPQGVWLVGEDIPDGHWSMKTDASWASISIGTALDETGKAIDYMNSRFISYEQVSSPSSSIYDPATDQTEVDFKLTDGTYVVIEYGSVIFTPYTGKPALSFQ